jgi:hypothetical protein
MTIRKTLNSRMTLAAAAFALSAFMAAPAHADRWGARQEAREGYFEVEAAKRKAERRIDDCETRRCVEREMRKGYRDVQKEKAEARREIRRELRDGDRYDRRPYR